MKKFRIAALLCALCLLFSACSERKAPTQLTGESDLLYAKGTTLIDNGNTVTLNSCQLYASAASPLLTQDIDAALADDAYNALCLQLDGDTVNTDGTWRIEDTTTEILEYALGACETQQKYLLVSIVNYPQSYRAWYEGSGFAENVTALWSTIANTVADGRWFGGYVLSGFPRAGSSENETALQKYEGLLSQIVSGIRTVDSRHLVVVGTMYPYDSDEDAYMGFPMLEDANFMYAATLEQLEFYTHQSQTTMDGAMHLVYPNDDYLFNVSGEESIERIEGSQIDLSFTGEQTRATSVFKVDEEDAVAKLGVYVAPNDQLGGGEMRVLSLHFAECDQDGNVLKTLYDMQSSVNVPFDFKMSSGTYGTGSTYEDGTAYLESIDESLFFYVRDLCVPLEKGKYYQLTVTLKQRNMDEDYTCLPAVQLYRVDAYSYLNAQLLEQSCQSLFAEAKTVGVPLMIYDTADLSTLGEEKGTETYLGDLDRIIQTLGLSHAH